MPKNNGFKIFISSLFVFFILVVSSVTTMNIVNKRITENSFDDLSVECKSLAKYFYKKIKTDTIFLNSLSNVLAAKSSSIGFDDDQILQIINSFDINDSFISYIECLDSNNHLLRQDGTIIDASGYLSFDEECKKGAYISDVYVDQFNSEIKYIRNASPVINNNKVIAIIYGIIPLDDLRKEFTTDIYDGNAFVYIEDGLTGNIILDTWHSSLGNIEDFKNRETLIGYSFEKAIQDMKVGRSGEIGFISKTIKSPLYLRYEPIGIKSWNILISVEQDYVFERGKPLNNLFFRLNVFHVIIFFIYIICISVYMIKSYQRVKSISHLDQTTSLKNRIAYDSLLNSYKDKNIELIVCVFIDVNGLHDVNNFKGHAAGDKLLQDVGSALTKEFNYEQIFRIGGDEFVVLCMGWDVVVANEKISRVIKGLESKEISVSVGIVEKRDQIGLNEIIKEADELMLKNKRAFYATHNRRNSHN